MSLHLPDEILRRVHYFIRQWIAFSDLNKMKKFIETMNKEYEDLPGEALESLEFFVDELIDGIDPLLEEYLIDAERYNSLPEEFKTALKADPYTIFRFNNNIREAMVCRQLIQTLDEKSRDKKYSEKKCANCIILEIIRNSLKMVPTSNNAG